MSRVVPLLMWSIGSGVGVWLAARLPCGGLFACLTLVAVLVAIRRSHSWIAAVFLGVISALAWAIPKVGWMAAMGGSEAGNIAFLVGWCCVVLVLTVTHAAGVVCGSLLWLRRGWPCSAALATSWLLGEVLADFCLREAFGLTLDPIRLATTQLNGSPLVQCADLGGTPLVGWLVALANGLMVDHFFTAKEPSAFHQRRTVWVLSGVLATAVLYGIVRPSITTALPGPSVVLIPDVMRNPSQEMNSLLGSAELAVWPETAVFGVCGTDDRIEFELRMLAEATEATIIVGCQRLGTAPVGLFNSAVAVVPGASPLLTSDKRFLGPVTEYAPPLAKWFGVPDPSQGYASGRSVCWTMPDGLRIGAGICHDASYPEWSSGITSGGADLLILLANEGFSESPQLKGQLLACSRLRAIESRRTLLRCANAGITAVIDGTGRVVTRTHGWQSHEPLVAGRIPMTTGVSLYHQCGNNVTIVLAVCVAILAEIVRRPQRRAIPEVS